MIFWIAESKLILKVTVLAIKRFLFSRIIKEFLCFVYWTYLTFIMG